MLIECKISWWAVVFVQFKFDQEAGLDGTLIVKDIPQDEEIDNHSWRPGMVRDPQSSWSLEGRRLSRESPRAD
jgi:hypothetical protein